MSWPNGARFAFTVVDDTERATVRTVAPVYALLERLGLRTTKTVWPLAFKRPPLMGGATLEDPDYRSWVLGLQDRGFEIASHGATDHTSPRPDTFAAMDRFRAVLGQDPRLHVNHVGQREAVYWGAARLDGLPKMVYRAAHGMLGHDTNYFGHVEDSPYFWGDLCLARVEYVRNFVYRDINTARHDPIMPYHDPRRPYVRHWFSASEGPDVASFCRLLSEANQDRLAEEGGFCIVYTHFAQGFVRDGRLDGRFVALMTRLASMPGWFVPASSLLDHLRSDASWRSQAETKALRRMQWDWLASKLVHGAA